MTLAFLAASLATRLTACALIQQETPPTAQGKEENPVKAHDNGKTRDAEHEATAKDGDGEQKYTNRLIKATSPYLLQHAHNPVDWYEWGEEAFQKAKADDKPIFLSIGYAACHWCHVMEHESFENEEVAALLNDHFVPIKVDREERPDIDELYMAYTQALTGGGGWPMSVWLTPERVPFHAGTYFPKPHFVQALQQIADTWHSSRDEISGGAESARKFFAQWSAGPEPAEGVISLARVDETAHILARHFDSKFGGIAGGSNKFPPSMALDLMLRVFNRRVFNRRGEPQPLDKRDPILLLEHVGLTLDHMARGGIYDHIGGGICRYSTDRIWLVPHFEKMLYDQAMVSAIYLDAYQVSNAQARLFADTARDIFDYVLSDLRSPEGGFYSSRDADSEGMEGKFYLWTLPEVKEVLGEEEGTLFAKYYDVTETGNWFERHGHAPPGPKNILHVTKPPDVFAKMHNLSEEEFRAKLAMWRAKMGGARNKRVPPGLDDKVLPDWNGLMIASLAKGAQVLDEPKYGQAAARAAEFILTKVSKDGRLLRTYRKGEARLAANLGDYAFMIEGLLNLYEATFERRWLTEARRLADASIEHFFDEKGGAFFFTADDAEQLIARSKHPHDGAIPSGNSVHAMNLQRLAIFFDDKRYKEKAESILRTFEPMASESPTAFERLLCAADFYHAKVTEIAIVGEASAAPTKALVRAVHDRYLPNKVVVYAADEVAETDIALLKGKRRINGQSTAYVCEHYRCKLPVTRPEDLRKQLDAPAKGTANAATGAAKEGE
jgi:uncharacterized protein YyaL (SSP411 family)